MTNKEWEQRCSSVKDSMREYAKKFVTPISMSEEPGHGIAWGTGSYIAVSGQVFVITAHHVIADVPNGAHLAHLPGPGDDYIELTGEVEQAGWPVDAAIIQAQALFKHETRAAVTNTLIDQRFGAVDRELLFWVGFPGFNANRDEAPTESRQLATRFGGALPTIGLPMLSQVMEGWDGSHKGFLADKHIAIHYPDKAKRTSSGELVPLRHPKGMSGSLLWDTKYVACMNTGALWGARARSHLWHCLGGT